MDGVLVIDKPIDWTSHDVVAVVRRILRQRRVGHTGTLDPFATGVLVVLIGRATRLARFLTDSDKEYEAVIRLGYATDTGDISGKPLSAPPASPLFWNEVELDQAFQSLRGDIQQVPPMYSAKKRSGEKLYELARKGVQVERSPVPVCIYEFEPIKSEAVLLKNNRDGTADLKVHVTCSAGTYIRTLAEDLGKRLGTGAHLAELRRTRAGEFTIQAAATVDQLKQSYAEESLGMVLRPPAAALSKMPFVHLNSEDARRARLGIDIRAAGLSCSHETRVRMLDGDDNLIGVAYFDADKHLLHPGVVLPA